MLFFLVYSWLAQFLPGWLYRLVGSDIAVDPRSVEEKAGEAAL